MRYVILIIYMAAAILLHFLTGQFPVSFFSFPLNFILAVIWIGSVVMLCKKCRKSGFVRFMLSKGSVICSIVLFLTFSLIVGISGWRNLVDTWIFAAIMLYFLTVLLLVILRGYRVRTDSGIGSIRWRFILNHAGLFIALSAAFWGAPDSETVRLRAIKGQPVKEAIRMDGTATWMSYDVELKDFRMEEYENGVPSMFEADLLVDGKDVTIRVNEPYSPSLGEDIYLTGYDMLSGADSDYCILQVVREPWKYAAVAGIVMMLAGALMLFIGGPRRRNDVIEI